MLPGAVVGLARCWVLREQPVGCCLGVVLLVGSLVWGPVGGGGLRVVTGRVPRRLRVVAGGLGVAGRSLLENCTVDASIFVKSLWSSL